MAEAPIAKSQTAQPAKERDVYSRPVFKQALMLNSLQAQRVMKRSFERVSHALFSINVILRIIGEQEEIDQVEEVILKDIQRVLADLDNAISRLKALMDELKIKAAPSYTHPEELEIEISSPQTAQFALLIKKLDILISLNDTLWLNSVLESQKRTDSNFEWQQRLIKLAGRIIGIEKRARAAAYAKGKESEVEQAAPAAEIHDAELAEEAANDVAPQQIGATA